MEKPRYFNGGIRKGTLAVRQTSPVLDSGNSSSESPYIRPGFVAGSVGEA